MIALSKNVAGLAEGSDDTCPSASSIREPELASKRRVCRVCCVERPLSLFRPVKRDKPSRRSRVCNRCHCAKERSRRAAGRSDEQAKMAHAHWADLANSSRRKNIARLVSRFIAEVGGVDELASQWVKAFNESSKLKRVRCGEALFKLIGWLEQTATSPEVHTKQLSDAELANQLMQMQIQAVMEMPEPLLMALVKQRGLEVRANDAAA